MKRSNWYASCEILQTGILEIKHLKSGFWFYKDMAILSSSITSDRECLSYRHGNKNLDNDTRQLLPQLQCIMTFQLSDMCQKLSSLW